MKAKESAANKNTRNAGHATEVRRRAETLLRGQQKDQRSKASLQKSEADAQRLLQELEVHRIELELQNAELQATKNALEEALEKYIDLYNFAPVGYLTLDREGAIRDVNLAGAVLLGIARSTLVNWRFGLFVSPEDRPIFDAFLQKVFTSKVRQGCEVALTVKGRPSFEVGMDAIAFASGKGCRVALTDITERRRAEADRLVLNKLESTGILAGGVAHDFNNLLTVIVLKIELAQRLMPPGEELARHLAEARQTSVLAQGLTSQFVTFAKGGAPVRRAMVLSGVIQEASWAALMGSHVHCEFSLAEDLHVAEVDAAQIAQVIRNLVMNAREAMPQGGVLSVRAKNVILSANEQSFLPAGEYVRLSIADQGTGIPKDVLPKIFEPYFSTKQRGSQKGMGLGLTICQAVVQKHGGAIAVESTVGVGTTFDIYLPTTRNLSVKKKAPVPKGVPRQRRILAPKSSKTDRAA